MGAGVVFGGGIVILGGDWTAGLGGGRAGLAGALTDLMLARPDEVLVLGVPGFCPAPRLTDTTLDRGLTPLERGVDERGVDVPDENDVVRVDLRAEGEDTVVGGVERSEDVELLRIEVADDLRVRGIVSDDSFRTGTRRTEAVEPEREVGEAGDPVVGDPPTGLRRSPVSTLARTALSTRGLAALSTRGRAVLSTLDRAESTRERASAFSSGLLSTRFRSPLSTLDLTATPRRPTPTPVCTLARPAPTPTSVVRTMASPSAFNTTDSSLVSLAILECGGRSKGLGFVDAVEEVGDEMGIVEGIGAVEARTRLLGRATSETVAGSTAPGTMNIGVG